MQTYLEGTKCNDQQTSRFLSPKWWAQSSCMQKSAHHWSCNSRNQAFHVTSQYNPTNQLFRGEWQNLIKKERYDPVQRHHSYTPTRNIQCTMIKSTKCAKVVRVIMRIIRRHERRHADPTKKTKLKEKTSSEVWSEKPWRRERSVGQKASTVSCVPRKSVIALLPGFQKNAPHEASLQVNWRYQ